ncbi:hypothetical protein DM806_21260 [Sphingobium lactosutens]|nr:hypothetical protein [Sphingobium lactosutens]
MSAIVVNLPFMSSMAAAGERGGVMLLMLRGGLQFRCRYILSIGIFSHRATPRIAKAGGAG